MDAAENFQNKLAVLECMRNCLQEPLKNASSLAEQTRALYCEGLLLDSLLAPSESASRDCVRAELSELAGKKVKESLIHPELLKAARKLIG